MHEMALCESLVAIIEEQATIEHFCRVHSVSLEVGALAGVEVEALRFGFQVVSQDTVAEGAELKILPSKVFARCPLCGAQELMLPPSGSCLQCGGKLHRTDGRELSIKEMEVE